MLVLSRRISESIQLSGGIALQILRIRGDQVKVGIDAPPEVIILRDEVPESSQLECYANPRPDEKSSDPDECNNALHSDPGERNNTPRPDCKILPIIHLLLQEALEE